MLINKKFSIKLLFLIVISPIYILIIFSILLIMFEFLGISKFINHNIINNEKEKIYELRETNYYKMGGLESGPYTEFSKQILHPLFFFSLPWDIEKIKKINNPYVSLNNLGFRNSLNFKNKKNHIVLLGGSTAFGHGSSSDDTTIASYLSIKTKYNSINKGVPSWNSYQEMLSLIKHKNDYKYVISLSASNDFAITCSNYFYYSKILDIPESFHLLNDYFYDIRDKNIIKFSKSIKKFLILNFPETKKVYKNIKIVLTNRHKKNNTNVINELSKTNFCGGLKNIDKLVDNFLYNQNVVRMIANENNAEHWLIIQPMLKLHVNSYSGNHLFLKVKDTEKRKMDIEIIKYYIDKIMSSDFCKLRCLNYSNIYDNNLPEKLTLFPDMRDINWSMNAIFIDEVHLTDIANEILADRLIKDIEFKN